MENIYNFIKIDAESMTHKYMQLSNAIIRAVEDKKIGKNYVMPSINDLSYELDISRSTCEKAYNHLKKIGIVGSVPGKGFFIADTGFNQNLKVLLLLNKLSAHKKLVYDSFASKLGDRAAIDLYIYNNDFSLFRKILSEKIGHYTHYVIIPPFIDGVAKAAEIISKIPDDQLILLDKLLDNNQSNFSAVYENFGSDIYHALKKAVRRLRKYDRIKLIFPEYSYYPQEIIEGFKEFCKEFQFEQTILAGIEDETIEDGTVYINVMEDDLVQLLEKILQTDLKPGKDIGIISYNETPMKKIIMNGITTISTNFKLMGEYAAGIILSEKNEKIAVPFNLTLRSSL